MVNCTTSGLWDRPFGNTVWVAIHYRMAMIEKLSWAVHHITVGFAMCTMFSCHPFMNYMVSMSISIMESSTIFLNLRTFASIWSCPRLYFVFGVSVLVIYPLTRLVWLSYLCWILWYKVGDHIEHLSAPGIMYVVNCCHGVVFILSAYYYFAVMLRKPGRFVILKEGKSHKC